MASKRPGSGRTSPFAEPSQEARAEYRALSAVQQELRRQVREGSSDVQFVLVDLEPHAREGDFPIGSRTFTINLDDPDSVAQYGGAITARRRGEITAEWAEREEARFTTEAVPVRRNATVPGFDSIELGVYSADDATIQAESYKKLAKAAEALEEQQRKAAEAVDAKKYVGTQLLGARLAKAAQKQAVKGQTRLGRTSRRFIPRMAVAGVVLVVALVAVALPVATLASGWGALAAAAGGYITFRGGGRFVLGVANNLRSVAYQKLAKVVTNAKSADREHVQEKTLSQLDGYTRTMRDHLGRHQAPVGIVTLQGGEGLQDAVTDRHQAIVGASLRANPELAKLVSELVSVNGTDEKATTAPLAPSERNTAAVAVVEQTLFTGGRAPLLRALATGEDFALSPALPPIRATEQGQDVARQLAVASGISLPTPEAGRGAA